MEFEEMQKIWDSQNNRILYAIDENALSKGISAKKQQTLRTSNVSELTIIITYIVAGFIILFVIAINKMNNMFMYLLSGWMFVTAVYAIVIRLKRINGNKKFDRTLSGDLDHAIATATHQVRFSRVLKWNIFPVTALVTLVLWNGNKSIWIIVGIVAFFMLSFLASKWEHNFYKKNKDELEKLKLKLEE